MIDTVIFDLDGTLLNTLVDLKGSVNHALKTYGLPERPLDDIRRFAGNGVERLVELSAGTGKDDPLFPDILDCFKAHYLIHCNDKTAPYDGVRELLAALNDRHFKMAVVSNKMMSATKELVALHFGAWIDTAIGAGGGMKKKPSPDTVFAALKALGSDTSHSVFVGDSEVDIATAANAGIPCIAVSWGFRSRQEQTRAGASVFADTPVDVLKYIDELNHSSKP